MYRDRARLLLIPVLSVACIAKEQPGGSEQPPPVTPPVSPPVTPPGPPLAPVEASSKAKLRFKGGERYAGMLAGALALERNLVCKELGQYDCVREVHKVTLLEVSPYRDGILEPLDSTAISTPVAVDRLALSACERRARLDFEDLDNAELFGALPINEGALTDVQAPGVQAVVETLFKRLVQRMPDAQEVESFRDLYTDMEKIGHPQLARSWASVSCFAVATMSEALFY